MNTIGSDCFSIIVPTFREANNISALVKRIAKVDFGARQFELILMDDNSNDGIADIVRNLQPIYPWLRLIIRTGKKGLSESVIEGFSHAQYPIWVIMDADLSHPPEKIPEMLTALAQPGVNIVIGSRYVEGGSSDDQWPLIRRVFSHFAAWAARVLVGVPVKDPLSGFVMLKKETLIAGKKLEPIGWKIGLEIMVKCRCRHIQEVPIYFAQRTQGASKLSLKVIINYLQHVHRLIWFKMFSI